MSSVQEQLRWLPITPIITECVTDMCLVKEAYQYGNDTSPDPSTKNGAILTDKHGQTLAYSANRFARGLAETQSRLNDRKIKYQMVVHAENGAVFNAARHGINTKGTVLYCPFYACAECAKAIIQSGIKKVVGHAQMMILASSHTQWVEAVMMGWSMLHEAGVSCVLFDGVIDVTARFNYEDVNL